MGQIDVDYYRRERYEHAEHWDYDPLSYSGLIYYSYVQQILGLWPRGGTHILDVGCGDGYLAGRLLAVEGGGVDYVAVDYSSRALEFARSRVPAITVFERDLTQPDWTDGLPQGYDRVLFVETLEHLVPDCHERVLRQIRGLMKPDGVMIASVPSTLVPRNVKAHYKHFDFGEFRGLCEAAGFVVQDAWGLKGYGWLGRRWHTLAKRISRPQGIWASKRLRRGTMGLMRALYAAFLARVPPRKAGTFLLRLTPADDGSSMTS